MAYKKSTEVGSLADILARVSGKQLELTAPKLYSAKDKSRAKGVLARLLEQANSCEVSKITHPNHNIQLEDI